MFHVFGVQGRLASGGLEQVRQVAGVRAAARVRALAHSGQVVDGEEHLHLGADAGAGRGSPEARTYAALQALDGGAVESQRQPLRLVSQVMSAEVLALGAGQPLDEAWRRMRQRGVAQAPVVAGMPGDGSPVVGLLDARELLAPEHWPPAEAPGAVWQVHAQALWQRRVASLMASPVPTVAPHAPLRQVAELLVALALPGLAVTGDEGQLLGFVSRTDLLRAMVADPPLDLWG